jgi:DNA-directed RNA polymerase specialized sigma24 family protein
MPALHKTSRQISAGFPSIAREDIAQHLLTTILEILGSNSLRNQRSHFAFAAIRLLRRNSFRWALRETKLGGSTKPDPSEPERKLETDMGFETKFLLNEFLSRCLSNQQINHGEYQLLISFKVEGIDAKELAAPLGLSQIAFRHRMQRILNRLRKIAREPSSPTKRRSVSVSSRTDKQRFSSAA